MYLLFNGIMKDKSADGGDVLTRPFAGGDAPDIDGPKSYLWQWHFSDPSTLQEMDIIFRQVPYEIER